MKTPRMRALLLGVFSFLALLFNITNSNITSQAVRHNVLFLSNQSRHKLVACALIRNMTSAAQQWVAFHVLQGFDAFTLYDDNSIPPLVLADFGSLANRVTIKLAAPKPDKLSRQWAAYADCLTSEIGNKTFVAIFDVDEFVYSCDESTSLPAMLSEYNDALEIQLKRCPRFGGAARYNVSLPVFSQLVRRSPGAFGEGEVSVRDSIPDCVHLKPKDEPKGVCFGATAPKSVFNMKRYTIATHQYLTIHGLRNKPGLPPVQAATVATSSRSKGVCCNHYFVRDFAEALWKARSNRNGDFYLHYVNSSGVRSFYEWVEDTTVRDRYTHRVQMLLRNAQVPFKQE